MAPPLVSVIVPTFNRADMLVEAVQSIIAQHFTDWELIVADDGSDDDSEARVAALGDSRVRFFAGAHSGRPGLVRNRGVAAAAGKWLAFLDSDDVSLPERLGQQLRAVANGAADWCYADHGLISEDGRFVPRRAGSFAPIEGRILLPLIREETSASVTTLLVRRDLFLSLGGFHEALRIHEDLDFTFRLAAAAEAAAVPDQLTMVREHPGRLTRGVSDPHNRTIRVFERLERRAPSMEAVAAARIRKRALGNAGARVALRKGRPLAAMQTWWRGRRRIRPTADRQSSP